MFPAIRRFHALALLALCCAFLPVARPAFAATYVVTDFGDTNNAGTLRRAINDANASQGPDTITFSRAGKITLSSSLPALSGGSITIDGRQAGTGNTPQVEISGNGTVRQAGLYITSSGNTISGLIINGFNLSAPGILIEGSISAGTTANNNTISYNYIGTNPAGTAAGFSPEGNNNDAGGVRIYGRASGNTIANNLISKNGTISSSFGVYIGANDIIADGSVASDNVVRDNIIGLDASGSAALGNGSDGVRIAKDARNTTVQNNVISANGNGSFGYGVNVGGQLGNGYISGNKVLNNKIGTTAAGTGTSNRAYGNRLGGVAIDFSQGTVVTGNLISGNLGEGVYVTQSAAALSQVTLDAEISNNVIGLDGTGGQALGNGRSGILVERGVAKVAITNNVISANNEDGIRLVGNNGNSNKPFTTTQVTISGNTIGLNAGRATVIGAQRYGVNIIADASGNSVDNNTVTGNSSGGVVLGDSLNAIVRNNQVTNNQIGTRASGGAVGNGVIGVGIIKGANNTIGPGNTIVHHTNDLQNGDGVLIQGSASTGNVVKGNTILENLRGIRVDVDASNNTIGGTTAADINVVRNNNLGVVIVGANAVGNRILHTTTSANTVDGINLLQNGNTGLAAPTIASAQFAGGTLTLNLTSAADCSGSGCTVEVFQNTVQENGEGKYFLASTTKTGSASGSVAVSVASCMPWITATVTDKSGNTSPFSAAVNAPNCTAGEPSTDVRPELTNPTPASQTVASGPASFKATLKNLGGQQANFNLAVSGLPANWNATVSPNPATNLGAGQSVEVTVNATIPANTDAGSYVATLTATTQGGTATSSVQATIIVPLVAGLTFSAATQPSQVGGPGERKCYDHTVTNTGNGPDTVTIEVAPPQQPQPWQSEISTGASFNLGRGEQRTVTVCVTVPSGNTPAGNYNTTVTARTSGGGGPISVTDVTVVQAAAVPEISTAPEQNVTPTAPVQVTFQHTIRNIGNASDSFALSLTDLPSGWTIVTAPPATVGPLDPNATSTQLSYTVQIPAKAAAGTYNLSFRATAQNGTKASVAVQDRVVVGRIAALTLTPATQSSTEEPDTTKTYEFTLKNDGNFTDQITLGASANQAGWNASTDPVGQVQLAAGASVTVKLVVTIPPGQSTSVVNVSTITATSLEGTSTSAQATTNIASISKAKLTPKDPVRRGTAGQSVTFDFTLQNSGSIADTFDTIKTTAINSAGIAVTTVITVETPVSLAPGATKPVKLSVRVPNDQPDNSTIRVTVRSTPRASGGVLAETIATVVIGPPYAVVVEPDRQSTNKPGELVRYTHIVTNSGSFEDSFELSTISNLGWETSVSPPSVRLQAGLSTAVEVTVRVPTSAEANAVGTTFVTARSIGDPSATDQAVDSTTVAQVAGVNVAPSRTGLLTQGRSLVFSHTILNTGNGPDTFTITTTQELNWPVTLSTTQTPKMGRGVSYPLQVQVRIPADADPNIANRVTIRVTSTVDGSVRQEIIDSIRPAFRAPDDPGNNRVYLPYILRGQ